MANTTVSGATAIHGQNPQFLVETVIRNRIYESTYWKEHCFALTAESIIDKAIEVRFIGGVYGNQKPTEFLCLLLKLLQIQPEKEILVEYLRADEFKYLRALAALYIRMTFRAVDVYELLEPLLKDYRKLRLRNMSGYSLVFMDEFVYSLLTEERVCDIIMPRLAKRQVLEENGELGPRKSRLLAAMQGDSDQEDKDSSKSRKAEAEAEAGVSVEVEVAAWRGALDLAVVGVQIHETMQDMFLAVLHGQCHGLHLPVEVMQILWMWM
uniref:Pre-mRNA-splicing factor 38 n=1 Tax=Psilocybe cubensis TaxID=181762 RepID=A0A8H7Y166_PSICU